MDFICKKCGSTFHLETKGELICENCKIHLDLLDQQLKVNQKRINKLEEHKKHELENPKSENPEIHLETIKRLEYNLQLEYKKRDGITKTMNSKIIF
jgi:uncharacterized Zn finger protein (UPF0148 family)